MTRLILTTSDSGSGALKGARIADAVIGFGYRFVWGPLPSDTDIATSLMPLSSQHDQADDHWLLRIYRKHVGDIDSRTGLIDLCEPFDTIELWIDPDPNAQLILLWLLDYLRPHEKIVSKLNLVQADDPVGNHLSEDIAAWRIPATKILNGDLEIAGLAGLARADAGSLVRAVGTGHDCASLSAEYRHCAAGRTSDARDGARRDRNADAGTDLGR